jgi:hypothetical protein
MQAVQVQGPVLFTGIPAGYEQSFILEEGPV